MKFNKIEMVEELSNFTHNISSQLQQILFAGSFEYQFENMQINPKEKG